MIRKDLLLNPYNGFTFLVCWELHYKCFHQVKYLFSVWIQVYRLPAYKYTIRQRNVDEVYIYCAERMIKIYSQCQHNTTEEMVLNSKAYKTKKVIHLYQIFQFPGSLSYKKSYRFCLIGCSGLAFFHS